MEAAKRITTLSPREREVLDALVAGRPYKVIAFDLGVSITRRSRSIARMMERLGVRQSLETIRLAVLARLARFRLISLRQVVATVGLGVLAGFSTRGSCWEDVS